MARSVVIERRYNGPADSANGGYTCGLLAREIEGPAEVTLRQPPPIDTELTIERDGDRALLLDREELVAEAVPAAVDWEVPDPVPVEDAREGSADSPFLVRPRPFVTCFVCGPDREPGDGLCIFTGPLAGRDELHAGTWTPDASLAGPDGTVRPEIVWASLDCPTSGPVANWSRPDGKQLPIVLARLAADLRAPVAVGREHVIVAWPIVVDGRKRHAGSALFTSEGEPLASARALWIELKPA